MAHTVRLSMPSRLARRIRGVFIELFMSGFLLSADTGHQQAYLFLGGGATVYDAADLTAAQHQNTVAQLQQHVQILADVNDGGACIFSLVRRL